MSHGLRRIVDGRHRDACRCQRTRQRTVAHGEGEAVRSIEVPRRIVWRRGVGQIRRSSAQGAVLRPDDDLIGQRVVVGIRPGDEHNFGGFLRRRHILIDGDGPPIPDRAHIHRDRGDRGIHPSIIRLESETVRPRVTRRGRVEQSGRSPGKCAVRGRGHHAVTQRIAVRVRRGEGDGLGRVERSRETLVLRDRRTVGIRTHRDRHRGRSRPQHFVVGLKIIITQVVGDPNGIVQNGTVHSRHPQNISSRRVKSRGAGGTGRCARRIEQHRPCSAHLAPDKVRRPGIQVRQGDREKSAVRGQADRRWCGGRGQGFEIVQRGWIRVIFNGVNG